MLPDSVDLNIAVPCYCTDNAAMIAALAWHYYKKQEFSSIDLDAYTRLSSSVMKLPFQAE